MSEDRARQLLRSLGDGVVPVEDAGAAARTRARVVPRIEAMLVAERGARVRRTAARRWGAIGVAAAMVVVVGAASAGWLLRRGSGAAAPSEPPEPSPVVTASAPVRAAVAARPAPSEAPAAVAPVAAPEPSAPPAAPEASAPPTHRAPAPVAEPSTLAAQNQLLARALDARRHGHDAQALALLNHLLERYPASPLAADARAERLRCLERLGRAASPSKP